MTTRASTLRFFRFASARARPAGSANSGQRALPSTVPPDWMMPPTLRAWNASKRSSRRPEYPFRTPNTSQPCARAPRVTARTAAFMPGASPPLVRTAIFFKLVILIAHCDALLQPGARRRRVGKLPARVGPALAHLDRVPAGAIDDTKAILVGRVVADEHRRALGERLHAEELLDRDALVSPRRLEL